MMDRKELIDKINKEYSIIFEREAKEFSDNVQTGNLIRAAAAAETLTCCSRLKSLVLDFLEGYNYINKYCGHNFKDDEIISIIKEEDALENLYYAWLKVDASIDEPLALSFLRILS